MDEKYTMEEKTEGLTSNYLITPGGTCCDKCGILGKHYAVDKQPQLYAIEDMWLCGKCLERRMEKTWKALWGW